MKRSWTTWAFVGGIVLLLTVFLGFQYNWLVQAGDAEREKMQKRVEADTKMFADDFNREIQAAYFNFQTDPKSWASSDWTEFNERYDYWRSKTEYPELIGDFIYFDAAHKATLRYNPETRVFDSIAVSPELEVLRTRVETEPNHKPILRDELALVMPVHASGPVMERIRISESEVKSGPKIKMPERIGHLVIKLNRDVVVGKLLPALNAKYFPDGSYKLNVTDKAGAPQFQTADGVTTADASGDLLALSPDNFMFFANRELMPKVRERKAVISQHVESHTFTKEQTDSNSSSVFTIELKNDGAQKRQSVIAGTAYTDDGWKLDVQHQAGSVAAFVNGEQYKRMLFGIGVYLLVVGAVLAIVISALRSQRYAQRQIDFVSSVSHEFRTPLAVIYSAGENLADGVTQDREQTTRYGQLIKAEGKKLSTMVEQILEFAGARSGRRSYKFAETSPANIVENALAECEPMLEENGFAVERSVAETLPSINADADALTAALQNLIQNSVKYSNGTRWLRVSASNGNGKVRFVVEDRGIGISPNEIGKVFEPFFRAKDVVDAQIHGNGLGLSLVKETAEAHGGKVTAMSEVGKGSRFTIELPQV